MRPMRMFVGIPLPEPASAKLSRTVAGLSLPESDFRRSRPQDWHITLQFLGNVAQKQFECLLPRLSAIPLPPVSIYVGTIEFLSSQILAAQAGSAELSNLAHHVNAATAACGFTPENRPWMPHITLARKKRGASRASMATLRTRSERIAMDDFRCKFVATEFFLYQSFTEPERARYEIRARFPLGDPGRIKMAAGG